MREPEIETAVHFRKNKQSILETWERQVREKVVGSSTYSRAALRDQIPDFLDVLFASLAKEVPKAAIVPTAEEHGEQRSELGNYSVEDIVMEYEVLRSVLTAVLELREPVENADRETIVSAIFTAVRKAIGEFSAREIKMRTSYEESLNAQLSALREERELRENFVSLLSHDLRTPLTAARMSAQLLLRQRAAPGALEKLAGRIIENLDRTDEMIRNLLDANRIKAGEKLPIQASECDAARVIRDALDDMTALYGNRFAFSMPTAVMGVWDEEALRRVMENLCGNAIKYGDTREINVSLRLLEDETAIEICVHNWGNPIAPQDLENLFHHFRRGREEKVAGRKGWGIGLTLVRGIAEAHGGTVSAESSAEKGTSFRVRLPREPKAAPPPRT